MKNDFGMIDAPVQSFFGNWLYWHACALAHNTGLWLRTLTLPRAFRRCRSKRLRLAFLNIAARLVRHGRQLHLRFGAAYPHTDAFSQALTGSGPCPRSTDPGKHPAPTYPRNPSRSRLPQRQPLEDRQVPDAPRRGPKPPAEGGLEGWRRRTSQGSTR